MAPLRVSPDPVQQLDLLYIHPSLGATDLNIPMGAIGLINGIDCRKLGVMAWELTPSLIEQAKVVAMGLHWYFPLAFVNDIANAIKAINPAAKIIVGGLTATIFARQLLQRYPVDYVILGDAEEVFAPLVEYLMNGTLPHSLSNVATKSALPQHILPVSQKAYDTIDPITVDWFPTYKDHMFSVQRDFPGQFHESKGVYPFIPVFRGCTRNCPACYANPAIQSRIFGRGLMVRSLEAVTGTLHYCESLAGINTVHIIGDFFDILPHEYGEAILRAPYSLNLTYDLFNIPSMARFENMAECFDNVLFICHLFRDHGTIPCPAHRKKLRALFKNFAGGNCRFLLFADFRRINKENSFLQETAQHAHVSVRNSAYWYISAPLPDTSENIERQFEHFYRKTATG
ncbi:MAG: hypothetical protein GQ559_07435 [Desulfobulbaceae bacterium]|nr:hypothetical protein [Desulfobulbaceae bacterium]